MDGLKVLTCNPTEILPPDTDPAQAILLRRYLGLRDSLAANKIVRVILGRCDGNVTTAMRRIDSFVENVRDIHPHRSFYSIVISFYHCLNAGLNECCDECTGNCYRKGDVPEYIIYYRYDYRLPNFER